MEKIPIKDDSEKQLFDALKEACDGIEFSSFEVGVSSESLETKYKIRQKSIDFVKSTFKSKHDSENFESYILVHFDRGFIEVTPTNVLVEGFYNKFSRDIAQTFHYCFKCRGRGCKKCNKTGKLSEESVQELIEKITLPLFESKESKFHGCGREDKDVLMLGKGRLFVIELVEPKKRSIDLKNLEEEINSKNKNKISVRGLKFVEKQRVVEIKNTPFEKIYSAKCLCSEISQKELETLINKKIKIFQRTPVRVEKRRADKKREKTAKILKAKLINEKEFSLEILSSHGLYIKEFISGDEKRTEPSISSMLGKECVCKELDVLEIVI
ncbi:MAG: tRNA pseudouridine(54/55) synthase Pus10 [Candidatus Diapherotrites archaeon]|uniref:tRNA pseudouridine(55) synthase n=1 Tax=Candidatus Iainarchaeum sp. TaxID=3101447 RepID=A0A2D6LQB0_9ARCH|nr:tRNA pseudouridine(54/55) synthase Pus10 [Candidatus Diapherotrites archaeon]|tara:strand:+ start:13289 stop:14266 length:978 start_codon:yes stop_codon:yes gene_type:complete